MRRGYVTVNTDVEVDIDEIMEHITDLPESEISTIVSYLNDSICPSLEAALDVVVKAYNSSPYYRGRVEDKLIEHKILQPR